MRQIFGAIFLISAIVTLIAVYFTFNQVSNEEKRLRNDIQYRSTLLAESLRETVEPNFINKSETYLQGVVEKFADTERIAGLAIIDNKGQIIAKSSALPSNIQQAETIAGDVMDSDKPFGEFVKLNENKYFIFAVPLHDDKSVLGSLMIAQNTGYIDSRLSEIWKNTLIRLFTQVFLLSIATILIIRWIIFAPIQSLVESLKISRINSNSPMSRKIPNYPFFKPLIMELASFQKSLSEARHSAIEEARLRSEKLDSPWTSERLKGYVKEILKGRQIILVSNREPYIHTRNGKNISYYFPASGMVTAMEPIMRTCGGTWIAHGSGNADKMTVDKHNRIKVPPEEPKYTLRRVFISEKEEKGYYYGFSNEGFWPLCHIAHTRPIFRKEDWEQYKKVNGKFAETVLKEIKNVHKPIILVQDYHFALLPRMIKNSRPDAVVGMFWHIPWPNSEAFSICPFRKEILDGMLGADLIGFHTQLLCNNFIDTIGKELESLIDWEQFSVKKEGHLTYIKPFPISIAFQNGREHKIDNNTEVLEKGKLLDSLKINSKYIGLGVDRLDYTKGILERFKAIEYFLGKNPSFITQFTFIQIAPSSRSEIERYRQFAREVNNEAIRINNTFKTNGWQPIVLINKRLNHEELQLYYRISDICLVTSLHDGMNLVAKEYIAARDDEKGVLILSQFAGASRELKDALIINPYNIEEVAESIKTGLNMMTSEQIKKMRKMREIIKTNNIYRWSAELLKTMIQLT